MNWNDLRFFLQVARSKSLSEAARKLGTSVSTVSRRIETMESALKLKLFTHHRDGYDLTGAGIDLMDPAENIEAQMRLFERAAVKRDGAYSGLVRVDMPELIGQKIIMPNLGPFVSAYPDIRLDIRSSVLPVRLRTQESDLVIRLVRPEQGNYKIRLIGKVDFRFYCSQAYLQRFGLPKDPSALAAHHVAAWPEDMQFLRMSAWLQEVCPQVRPSMFLASFAAQLQAVSHGYCIAVLPSFAAEPEGLIPILTEIPPLSLDLWLLVHVRTSLTPRVQKVRDLLIDILSEHTPMS